MATISSNIQPPQPVTLCYKRIHKLLPHLKQHHNNITDTTPAASPRGSPRASPRASPRSSLSALALPHEQHSRQHSSASSHTPHTRLTPDSYPCPPRYHNKRRLPYIQQQWFAQQTQHSHRRTHIPLEWHITEVKEIRADWNWTINRLTKRIGKVDGVHITKGLNGRRQSVEGVGEEREEGKGGEEKVVVDGVIERVGMWNTQSLLIRVDSAAGEEKHAEETKQRDDEREHDEAADNNEDDDEKRMKADTVAARHTAGSNGSPIRPARTAFLSPTRQRRISEEEQGDKPNQHPALQSSLTPSLLPSPTSSTTATPRFSFPLTRTNSTDSTTKHNNTTTQSDITVLENTILATFNPLPPPFIPSITITRDGSTSTRQLKHGEDAVLSELRDEFRFGVCGVGVLCRLNVYGYVVWVKEEEDKPQWAQHLRSTAR